MGLHLLRPPEYISQTENSVLLSRFIRCRLWHWDFLIIVCMCLCCLGRNPLLETERVPLLCMHWAPHVQIQWLGPYWNWRTPSRVLSINFLLNVGEFQCYPLEWYCQYCHSCIRFGLVRCPSYTGPCTLLFWYHHLTRWVIGFPLPPSLCTDPLWSTTEKKENTEWSYKLHVANYMEWGYSEGSLRCTTFRKGYLVLRLLGSMSGGRSPYVLTTQLCIGNHCLLWHCSLTVTDSL